MKVNALLTPGIAPLNQDELASEERMKGMDYPEDFLLIDCITCSWLLIRTFRLSDRSTQIVLKNPIFSRLGEFPNDAFSVLVCVFAQERMA